MLLNLLEFGPDALVLLISWLVLLSVLSIKLDYFVFFIYDIFIKIPVLGTCCWCANYANHLPSYWSIKMGSQSSLDENKKLSFKN